MSRDRKRLGGLCWRPNFYLAGFGPPPPEGFAAWAGLVEVHIDREKRGEGSWKLRAGPLSGGLFDTADEAAMAALPLAIRAAKNEVRRATAALRKLEKIAGEVSS